MVRRVLKGYSITSTNTLDRAHLRAVAGIIKWGSLLTSLPVQASASGALLLVFGPPAAYAVFLTVLGSQQLKQ